MSKYMFTFQSDMPGGVDVTVSFDDTDHPFIEDVLQAFEQFLLGVTFQPGSIKKYLDTDAVTNVVVKRMQADT